MPEPRHLERGELVPTAEASEAPSFVCDLCGKKCRGTPEGSGLFMWTRGEEVRTEEPPLCAKCAKKLTWRALAAFSAEGGGDE